MRRWMQICLSLLLAVALLGALAYAYRSPLVTALAGFALDHQDKLRCSKPEIDVSSSLRIVTISPIDCDVATGPLAHAKTFTPMRIELGAIRPERLEVERATLDYRERDVSHVRTNTAADLAQVVGMSDSLIKGMLDASEMYSSDSPRIVVEHLTMLRGGKRDSVMHGFWLTVEGEWNRSYAARVEVPVEGLVSVRNFDMSVTPARGKLAMAMYLGEREPGEKPDALLRLEGKQLDQQRPAFELSLKTGDAAHARAR